MCPIWLSIHFKQNTFYFKVVFTDSLSNFVLNCVLCAFQVNEKEMQGVTREEAVLYLLHIQDYVNLIVQHMKEGEEIDLDLN